MPKRLLLLTEGNLGVFNSKTAVSLMRYVPEQVVGVLDSHFAGQSTKTLLGIDQDVPIFTSLQEAQSVQPNVLVIGVAPQGGTVGSDWMNIIIEAIRQKMDIYSGLHVMLNENEVLHSLAEENGVRLWDVRKAPENLPVAKALVRETKAVRVLTMGTDCNIGKMVTTLEIYKALQSQGVNAGFIATGQTGVMIAQSGIAIDRVISDFTAGAVEQMILQQQDKEVLVIEGQGSLLHPGFSGVTLSLLHGSLPHGIVLCHHVERKTTRGNTIPIAPLQTHIDLCLTLCEPISPTQIIGIALNTVDCSKQQYLEEKEKLEQKFNLPVVDVIRESAKPLAQAIQHNFVLNTT